MEPIWPSWGASRSKEDWAGNESKLNLPAVAVFCGIVTKAPPEQISELVRNGRVICLFAHKESTRNRLLGSELPHELDDQT
jgi:hypothetical protein